MPLASPATPSAPTASGLIEAWRRNKFWITWAAIAVCFVLKCLIALKVVYFSESDGSKFFRTNLFWDDGGVYVASMIMSARPEMYRDEWARRIVRDIPARDLVQKWGKWGLKIPAVLRPFPANPYLIYDFIGRVFARLTGDFRDAFVALMLLYPLLVLMKQ